VVPLSDSALPTPPRPVVRVALPERVAGLLWPVTSVAAPLDSLNVHSAAGPEPALTVNVHVAGVTENRPAWSLAQTRRVFTPSRTGRIVTVAP
jgi:hypothetical protein